MNVEQAMWREIHTKYSPQAGLGEPTWPVRLSPTSIQLITQVVSVIPYPSVTRPPKQLLNGCHTSLDQETIYINKLEKDNPLKQCIHHYYAKTYIFKNSMTSGDKGEAPDTISRTRPPSFSFILLKTNLSHMGDGFLPGKYGNWKWVFV